MSCPPTAIFSCAFITRMRCGKSKRRACKEDEDEAVPFLATGRPDKMKNKKIKEERHNKTAGVGCMKRGVKRSTSHTHTPSAKTLLRLHCLLVFQPFRAWCSLCWHCTPYSEVAFNGLRLHFCSSLVEPFSATDATCWHHSQIAMWPCSGSVACLWHCSLQIPKLCIQWLCGLESLD